MLNTSALTTTPRKPDYKVNLSSYKQYLNLWLQFLYKYLVITAGRDHSRVIPEKLSWLLCLQLAYAVNVFLTIPTYLLCFYMQVYKTIGFSEEKKEGHVPPELLPFLNCEPGELIGIKFQVKIKRDLIERDRL